MKLLFDHQIFNFQKFGGISRYFAGLHEEINKSEHSVDISMLYTDNFYARNFYQPLKNLPIKWLFKKKKRITKWNKAYSKYILNKNQFDVFHPTFYNPYFLDYLKKPLVVTVHDMTHEVLPEYFPTSDILPNHKRILIDRADKIIAISNSTKDDIIRFFPSAERKIEVIHHGIDLEPATTEPILNLPEKYILYVGERGGYKNFFVLAEAFKQALKTFPELKLVLAGGGPFSVGDRECLVRANILNATIQLSVTDGQMNNLYQHAQCFVFPSLYEGFGYPVLEAFKNDCPLILSDIDCFREIAGPSAAMYFSPFSATSLAKCIIDSISEPSTRKTLITNGQWQLKKYPISECVSKTLNVYQSM